MRFRKNCFSILALLMVVVAILWVASGVSESNKTETNSEAEETGKTIGQGIGVGLILCISIPLVFFFALMAWRNSVGLATERRHKEQLDALRGQQPPVNR